MTVGTEGEPEDPYGYLYRPGPGEAQGGVPSAPPSGFGTSAYVQVGQTRYGQPQPYPQPAGPETQAYSAGHAGQPTQATQAIPGGPASAPPGVPPQRRDGGGHGGRGGGSRGRGPLIGAIVAVVVVVAVIAGVLAMNSDGDDEKGTSSTSPSVVQPSSPAASSQAQTSAPASSAVPDKFGENEAENAQLAGGAAVANNAQKFSGTGFVNVPATPGASITITVEAPAKGTYSLNVTYANPDPTGSGKDRPKRTLTVGANGDSRYGQLNMYGTGSADSWYSTWRTVDLNEGTNAVSLTCQPGDSCNVAVDKMWIGPKK